MGFDGGREGNENWVGFLWEIGNMEEGVGGGGEIREWGWDGVFNGGSEGGVGMFEGGG